MSAVANYDLPAPVQAYQLPNGEFVTTPEDYFAKMYEAEAELEAGAYVFANAGEFARGQDTRAFNTIKGYAAWRAGAVKMNTLDAIKDEYLQSLNAAAEKAKAEAEARKAQEAAPVAIPSAPEAPPVAVAA